MNGAGKVIASACSFDEDLVLADLDAGTGDLHETFRTSAKPHIRRWCSVHRLHPQCGFSKVLIGLSGGIDSHSLRRSRLRRSAKENVQPA